MRGHKWFTDLADFNMENYEKNGSQYRAKHNFLKDKVRRGNYMACDTLKQGCHSCGNCKKTAQGVPYKGKPTISVSLPKSKQSIGNWRPSNKYYIQTRIGKVR
jgi:hypothetical protein